MLTYIKLLKTLRFRLCSFEEFLTWLKLNHSMLFHGTEIVEILLSILFFNQEKAVIYKIKKRF